MKDKGKDSDSSDSSSDESSSSSNSSHDDKDKEPKPQEVTAKAKAKTPSMRGKKVQVRPLITLDDIPTGIIEDPQVLWDCEKCFKTSANDKLSAYYILSPQGDSNKADVLQAELAPFIMCQIHQLRTCQSRACV